MVASVNLRNRLALEGKDLAVVNIVVMGVGCDVDNWWKCAWVPKN
jgi:hypothetical protein